MWAERLAIEPHSSPSSQSLPKLEGPLKFNQRWQMARGIGGPARIRTWDNTVMSGAF